ncbi:MAG: FAD-dependent oxidoreductase [Bryobacteraceae bacterium]|jgi:succinate dehydrogenase/fumarate reductase flavoprotein subunit
MSKKDRVVNRRSFFKRTAAAGLGVATAAGQEQNEHKASQIRFDRTADVVVVGAGASGLPAAIMARDHGASVIVIDANHDIGGHAMLSGGRIPLGGGTSWQKKYGITDSADQVYLDHTNHRNPEFRHADRDLVRAWADENAASFEFLIENGVIFNDVAPVIVNGGSVPRLFVTKVFSDDLNETINGRPGSGLVRHLEASARKKGVTFLLRHKLTRVIREKPSSGRALGITAQLEGRDVNIQAKKGVILATGGHTSNVEFRRRFDPRLTEEYQTTGEPWTRQNADSEILALAMGATMWSTANQANPRGLAITKTIHIGCRYGYRNLKWEPGSPMFKLAGASGLTVRDFQDVILVNQIGQRFWNEVDESYDFLSACMGTNGSLGKNGSKANGGGPIWAIFDSDAVKREGWDPQPPNVDLNGWFFSADTIAELAGKIKNPYQFQPVPARALEETVAKYNSYVDMGKDQDFAKPTPKYKVQTPPFHAAWSTPILHDTLTGIKINSKCQVVDVQGKVIEGLYCAGESAGGFALHGLPRVIVFGRIAGREAALVKV